MKKLTLTFAALLIMMIQSNAAFSQLEIIYTVKESDEHLSDVAEKIFGNSMIWPAIWAENEETLSSPDDLYEGMELIIPDYGMNNGNYPHVKVYYTVTNSDESLWDIAAIVYDNSRLWPTIWEANQDKMSSTDDLYTGLVLRIPILSEEKKEEYLNKYEKYKKWKEKNK